LELLPQASTLLRSDSDALAQKRGEPGGAKP
jgi:hypothetical protein